MTANNDMSIYGGDLRMVIFECFDERLETYAVEAAGGTPMFRGEKTYRDHEEWYWAERGKLVGHPCHPDQWETASGCWMAMREGDHMGFVHGVDCSMSKAISEAAMTSQEDRRMETPLCQKQFSGEFWDVTEL